MNALEHIRKNIFRVGQIEMGKIAGTSQTTIWRWEHGETVPTLKEMRRIRAEAEVRGIYWHDDFFYRQPIAAEAVGES